MRKRTVIGCLVALVIMLIGGVYASRSATAAGSDGQPHPIPANNSAVAYSPGIPAIVPSGMKRSGIMLAAGISPSLTESDVRSYFNHGAYPPAAVGAHPSIVKLVFVSARQASAIMHDEFVDRPENVTVCYVLLKGPFDFEYSHPYLPGTTYHRQPENYVEEVFDAYSGNLLLWGIPANM